MRKRLIKWALVLIWAAVIFIFSSQPGNMSNENNRFVIEILKKIGINLNAIIGGNADFIIRKIAHLTEFLILFVFLHNALIDDYYFIPASLFAIAITFLYASSDEFHQIFVPNRGPAVFDVFIDTLGGLTGMAIIYLKELVDKKNGQRPYKYKDTRID